MAETIIGATVRAVWSLMRGTKFKPKTQVLITSLLNEDIFSKVMVDFTP